MKNTNSSDLAEKIRNAPKASSVAIYPSCHECGTHLFVFFDADQNVIASSLLHEDFLQRLVKHVERQEGIRLHHCEAHSPGGIQ